MNKQGAFSLIEVLFAVTFLIMVGLAMSSLNSATLNLSTKTELKISAFALNNESLAFVALTKKSLPATGPASFGTVYASCIGNGQVCYVNCPLIVDQNCQLTPNRQPIQLGDNRLQFVRQVVITPSSIGGYFVKATTAWGGSARDQVSASEIIN